MDGFFSSAMASPMMQYGMTGLTVGVKTGTGIANAMYNAAAMRMQAKAIQDQSNLQAYLIRVQYAAEYDKLKGEQDRQQSYNRVYAAKAGITGASANAAMQSYAGQAQKNLEVLYYNAAMKTGQQSLSAISQRNSLLAKAAQYDWQAVATGITGAVSLTGGILTDYTRQMAKTTTTDPTANLTSPDTNAIQTALTEFQAMNDLALNVSSGPSLV